MNDDLIYQVIWREAMVGTFTVTGTDHQYWEGPFRGNGTEACMDFIRQSQAVDPKRVYADLKLGVGISLRKDAGEPITAVVFGLDADFLLSIRWYYAPTAVEWIRTIFKFRIRIC